MLLRILKSVEFGEDASWTTDTDSGLTSSATATAEIQLGGRVKALEELLVDKSRRLQNDNVGLKMQNQQLSGMCLMILKDFETCLPMPMTICRKRLLVDRIGRCLKQSLRKK